jgi:hypothetical protein
MTVFFTYRGGQYSLPALWGTSWRCLKHGGLSCAIEVMVAERSRLRFAASN